MSGPTYQILFFSDLKTFVRKKEDNNGCLKNLTMCYQNPSTKKSLVISLSVLELVLLSITIVQFITILGIVIYLTRNEKWSRRPFAR